MSRVMVRDASAEHENNVSAMYAMRQGEPMCSVACSDVTESLRVEVLEHVGMAADPFRSLWSI
jgi:hypothetical protein